jgi:hypothetical protein
MSQHKHKLYILEQEVGSIISELPTGFKLISPHLNFEENIDVQELAVLDLANSLYFYFRPKDDISLKIKKLYDHLKYTFQVNK